jgi:uncharacterized protein YndB with AHSA1/START domain
MTKTIVLERTYEAHLDDVWELWTTADGIAAWWGPEGFEVVVSHVSLRVGGHVDYVMTAIGAEQQAFLARAGRPTSTQHRFTFSRVTPKTGLTFSSVIDFIPGVAPYETVTRVDLRVDGPRVHLCVELDAMHDAHWTKLATMGWESQLGRLAAMLSRRSIPGGS